MDSDFCPKVEKCPIFVNNVLTIQNASVAYKTLYCQAGKARYTSCKRFQISNIAGSCPQNVMPNSAKSIEQILAEMQK